ncbi:hypothetical protein [Streptomyces sp. TLI_171]|uniref:hypothetical protein n=1 Tax=Streptomyces sp. TLI_171 TaxID=1938859 RepID=UPI000C19A56E|nr:hypothetical protein [Streptomyces sp. TLI_171]RKE23120.1 hypothetical protein BX266_6577 [Streptomyces sp. TLI_171]
MPRNRPRALRARTPAPRGWTETAPLRIHGLSPATSLEVHRVERHHPSFCVKAGATALALRRYRSFLRPFGGRPLYPRESWCSACPGCNAVDDVRHSRDVLHEVLQHLPPRARAELARCVRPLDQELRRRTLPDPFAPGHRGGDPWWYRRLAEPPWG